MLDERGVLVRKMIFIELEEGTKVKRLEIFDSAFILPSCETCREKTVIKVTNKSSSTAITGENKTENDGKAKLWEKFSLTSSS